MDRWSVKARRPAPSSLQILFQGGVGCNEVVAADRGGIIVDIEREVDVRLDVILLRRGDVAAAMAAIVVGSHAQLRLRPADGVLVAGEQLHHLNEVKRSGTCTSA